jgi:hypothetical protein
VTGLALIDGYTTAFWWSAAILTVGAILALILFRNGPLVDQAGAEHVPGHETDPSVPSSV